MKFLRTLRVVYPCRLIISLLIIVFVTPFNSFSQSPIVTAHTLNSNPLNSDMCPFNEYLFKVSFGDLPTGDSIIDYEWYLANEGSGLFTEYQPMSTVVNITTFGVSTLGDLVDIKARWGNFLDQQTLPDDQGNVTVSVKIKTEDSKKAIQYYTA